MNNSFNIYEVGASARYGILDVSQFKNVPKRDLEAKATAFLLGKLLNDTPYQLSYYETGKPYLIERHEKISFSHSHDRVAVMVDEEKETGIDIELIRDKVKLIKHKFISEKESNDSDLDNTEKLLVYWAAKETMYKIYGRKNLDFRADLFVEPFKYNPDGAIVYGSIKKDAFNLRCEMNFKRVDNYILVYSV